jgi:hypothetical protein
MKGRYIFLSILARVVSYKLWVLDNLELSF